MTKPNETDHTTELAQRWALYNTQMADLFTERNQQAMDSPEREAAAQKILSLWLRDGD